MQQGIQLLSDKGYHGTGLKEILTAVNVPKGSFYHYFASKEAYVAEMIEQYCGDMLQRLDDYIASSDQAPLAILEHVYLYMLDIYAKADCRQGCLLGDLAAEVASTSEVLRSSMMKALSLWQSRVINLLQLGQENGSIRTDMTTQELANLLWATWEGGVLQMKIEQDTTHLQRTLTLLFQVILPAQPQD